MPAANTDLFTEVGLPGTATQLGGSGYTAGVTTSLTVGSTTNWPTATGVIFAIDVVDSSGVRVDGTYCEFAGTVASGTSITNVDHMVGTDQNYAAGATTRVYIPVSSERENRLVEGMLVEHTQAGSHVMTSPKVITGINDTNGNELLKVTATGSAVNELTLANAATGNGPTLSATGGDADIDMNFAPKGAGKLKGVVNNLFNPYKFHVHPSGTQTSITSATFTTIVWGTEDFDTGGNFASNTFTAPIAGFYQFNVNLQFNTLGGLYRGGGVRLLKNGATTLAELSDFDDTTSFDHKQYSLSEMVQLAASDTIVAQGLCHMSSSTGVFGTSSSFSGFLVSAT